MAPHAGTNGPTDPPDSLVRYARGTIEWRILHRGHGEPPLRVRRANTHHPTFIELFKRAIEKSGKAVPNVDLSSRFRYSKLGENEIRILRLYPSKHPEDVLKADLFKRRLDSVKGQYEALSYCWGTGAPNHEIQMRDLNATRPVMTTKSQLELKHNRTSKEVQDNPITLLPNYKFSPRDLFIVFVTRSIHSPDKVAGCYMPALGS